MTNRALLKPIAAKPGEPLYVTVREVMRGHVNEGLFVPGQQLPSTKQLSESLDVSLVTVHRALRELVAGGVLRRGQGRGTFVHEDYRDPDYMPTLRRFGLVFHDEASLADLYHGQVLEGVRRGAEQAGVDLVLLRYGEDWRNECDGYVYVNPYLEQLDRAPRFGARQGEVVSRRSNPPTMIIGARPNRVELSYVDVDNIGLAEQAVDHLVSLGHRRIGFVGGGLDLSNNVDRMQGFRSACRRHGISIDEKHVHIAGGWKLDPPGVAAMTDLLRRKDRPTAIFAGGYYFALDVYAACARAGLAMPADLSVVGVDDPASAEHLSPPLTTMRQPLIEMGRAAVSALFETSGEQSVGRTQRTLLPELVRRGSTCAYEGNGRG